MARIRIYADEHVDPDIVAGLRLQDVDAWAVRDAGNFGLSDERQLEYAAREHAAIFTHDTDFLAIARLRERGGKEHWGVIYARQGRLSVGECVRRLRELAGVLDAEELCNRVEFL